MRAGRAGGKDHELVCLLGRGHAPALLLLLNVPSFPASPSYLTVFAQVAPNLEYKGSGISSTPMFILRVGKGIWEEAFHGQYKSYHLAM